MQLMSQKRLTIMPPYFSSDTGNLSQTAFHFCILLVLHGPIERQETGPVPVKKTAKTQALSRMQL